MWHYSDTLECQQKVLLADFGAIAEGSAQSWDQVYQTQKETEHTGTETPWFFLYVVVSEYSLSTAETHIKWLGLQRH